MTRSDMTDWKALALAKGMDPDERVTAPLAKLEAQFAALRPRIALETEPLLHHVLPLPEQKQ